MFYPRNQKKNFFIQSLAVVLTALFLLSGCDDDDSKDKVTFKLPEITGYWISDYDGFEVTSDGTFKYYYDTSRNVAFQGTIETESSELDDTDGGLVIHLTEDGVYIADYYGSYDLDYRYMIKNYYTIVRWRNLAETTCEMSSPYKDGSSESRSAKSEAITGITTVTGYFGYFGTYTKQ